MLGLPSLLRHQHTMSTIPSRQSKFGTVLRVTRGNFMEMFDFFLFGFYATHISKTFLPVGDELPR